LKPEKRACVAHWKRMRRANLVATPRKTENVGSTEGKGSQKGRRGSKLKSEPPSEPNSVSIKQKLPRYNKVGGKNDTPIAAWKQPLGREFQRVRIRKPKKGHAAKNISPSTWEEHRGSKTTRKKQVLIMKIKGGTRSR